MNASKLSKATMLLAAGLAAGQDQAPTASIASRRHSDNGARLYNPRGILEPLHFLAGVFWLASMRAVAKLSINSCARVVSQFLAGLLHRLQTFHGSHRTVCPEMREP